jgi:hypothetical protein
LLRAGSWFPISWVSYSYENKTWKENYGVKSLLARVIYFGHTFCYTDKHTNLKTLYPDFEKFSLLQCINKIVSFFWYE